MRRSIRSRAVAALATLAVAGGSAVALAPPASAAAQPATLTATSSPIVYINVGNQLAGNWEVEVPGNIGIGDTVEIQLDDQGVDPNCDAATDIVQFAGVPTITMASGDTAAFTGALSQSAGACDTLNANDTLTLTATAADATGSDLVLSNVRLSVTGVETGPIRYQINDAGGFVDTDSNASVSDVRVTFGTPPLLSPTAENQAVPNIVLTELRPGAIAVNECVELAGPAGAAFDIEAPPVEVTETGGDGDAGAVTTLPGATGFLVTTPSTTATIYTLSGLRLDTPGGGVFGPEDVTVGTCADTDLHHQEQRLAFFGTVDRLAGSTRFTTAQLVADQIDPLSPASPCLEDTDVIIARGDNFPDALAAAYLAGQEGPDSNTPSPILLVTPTSIPTETANALRQHGVNRVMLIGGTQAISQGVQDALAATKATDCNGDVTADNIVVERIFGTDRYATAKAVATRNGAGAVGTINNGLDSSACVPAVPTAIVTSGVNFPDAVAAGGLSAGGTANGCGDGRGLPLVLTAQNALPEFTRQALLDLNVDQVILMGGPVAVSAGVEAAIEALGIDVVRVAGETRAHTAALLALKLGDEDVANWDLTRFLLSRPDNFPDALVAGPLAALTESPILLTETTSNFGLPADFAVDNYRAEDEPGFRFFRGTLLGGTDALAANVETQTRAVLASQP